MHVDHAQIYIYNRKSIKYTGMFRLLVIQKKKMKYFMMTTMNYPV